MDRRSVILGAAAAVISNSVAADKRTMGPLSQVFVKKPDRIIQHCPLWCWAASTAMIFSMNNHPVDQEEIIRRVFQGNMICTTGMPITISKLLSSQWIDQTGISFQSKILAAYDFMNGIVAIDNNIIINELLNDRPLLYANKHHAMVVVSMEYVETPYGPNVQSVGVLDPWPTNPWYHPLTPMERLVAHQGGEYSYIAAVNIS